MGLELEVKRRKKTLDQCIFTILPSQAFFVQNRKTQFQVFKNSDPKNLEKLSFCLKTQFQTSQKQGICKYFHEKLLEK